MTSVTKFNFELRMNLTLSVEQIWPDGDAPDNPTAEDAMESLKDSGNSLFRALDEWNMEDAASLVITNMGKPTDKAQW